MEEEVKKEKSCGAIVYRYLGTDLYILMIQMNLGHWSFPKGHVEGNESELETAIREVKEETNIDILIDRFRISNNITTMLTLQVIFIVFSEKATTIGTLCHVNPQN